MYTVKIFNFILGRGEGMELTGHTFRLIELALEEDLGRGDCTTNAIVPKETAATANIVVKENTRIAGLPLVHAVFRAVDKEVQIEDVVLEGEDVPGGTIVCRMSGTAASILTAERTALNFLARLCGIASLTRAAVAKLSLTNTRLLDTRKTTPGWRMLEKYAVRTGGGYNHRFGLDDMVLIKDNHIAVVGDIQETIRRARANIGISQKIEVEVGTLVELEAALQCNPDMILLDNMDTPTLREAVAIVDGRVLLEASGNMNLERLPEVAQTGVDFISIGSLTHGAKSIDVSLDIAF